MEKRVLKSSFSGIKGAKKERKLLEESSTRYLGPGCREFESRHSDHKSRKSIRSLGFYLLTERLKRSNATVRWTVACRRLDGGNTSIFFPSEKMQTSLATRARYQLQVHQESHKIVLDFTPNYNDIFAVEGGCRYDDHQRIRFPLRLQHTNFAVL